MPKEAANRGGLPERNAYPLFLPPNDMGSVSAAICRDNQYEVRGNAYRTGNFKRSTGGREIAKRAINRTAVKLDGSGFKHTKPRRFAVLVHAMRLHG